MKSSDFVKRLPIRFDAYSLKREWARLSSNVPIEDRQISLTHTPDCPRETRWTQGNGSLFWKHKNPDLKFSEKSFTELNAELQEIYPYLWKVCQQMKETFPIGRIRMMTMEPGYTYPLHHDFERRWHIPIIAPVDSFIYFKNSGQSLLQEDLLMSAHGFGFFLPDDGFVYEISAHLEHTACNSGNMYQSKQRVHLVFDEAIP